MLIYVAHPIDRANQHNRTKISGALAALGGGRAHLNGNHLYIPSAAFKLGPGAQPDQTINAINATALEESEAVLALWPADAKSWGVPIEVDRAANAGRRVALVVEDEPTWAMVYPHEGVQVFKTSPDEFDAFTMATLRAMDWLTGYERTERPLYKPGRLAHPMRINSPVVNITADDLATAAVATHSERAFVQHLSDAVSDGATEGLSQGETDSEPEKGDEGQGEATESRPEIGVRSLASWSEGEIATLPTRGYPTDAGLDIYVSETTVVEPHSFVDVRSHVAINLPAGFWGYLVGRSSTLRKKGLLVNPGVIDNGYTGELYSAVWNLTSEPVKIHAGERVAQLILMPNITPNYAPAWTNAATDSERGNRGFGSSGV